MTTNAPTRPEKTLAEAAAAEASRDDDIARADVARADVAREEIARPDLSHFAAEQRAQPRVEKLLGCAVCLLALAAGVATGLFVRATLSDAAVLASRRATVAELSAAEKDQLRRQYARFAQLTDDQRDHLRSFDQELDAADDQEALRGTLRRYNDWLRTITPTARGELLKLADQPSRRAERVQELSPLAQPDLLAVERWLKACVKARVPRSLASAPDVTLLSWGQGLLYEPLFSGREPRPAPKFFGALRPLDEADFVRLAADLSDHRRGELERKKGALEKKRLVSSWWQRRRAPGELRSAPASAEELVRFYNDELNDEIRAKLVGLPPEQRNRELRKLERFLNPEERQRLLSLPPEQRDRELRDAYRKVKAAEAAERT